MSPKAWNRGKKWLMEMQVVYIFLCFVHLSLFCTSFVSCLCSLLPIPLSLGIVVTASQVMSILELSFLHTTMSSITALCTSRQFTAVWHHRPSPDTALSCGCNQLGQLRAAGRSGCQLTSGASWWLLQSAKGLTCSSLHTSSNATHSP